jgi:glyoxylase-like metal-dependent hydrolase (beta-lactamase superfamily II)
LSPSIYLVGSGWLGFGLTDPYDCHVYAVDCGGSLLLVDAGSGRTPERIIDVMEADGIDSAAVGQIVLTHAHADHIGGARQLASRLAAEVWAPALSAEWIEGGDEVATGLAGARKRGIYPTDYSLPACSVDRRLDPGQAHVGELELAVLATPGHAPDHLALVAEVDGVRVAFCGDLVFARGRVVLTGLPAADDAACAESIRALAQLEPDVLLPGHGEVVMHDAGEHLAAALQVFDEGGRPPSLA